MLAATEISLFLPLLEEHSFAGKQNLESKDKEHLSRFSHSCGFEKQTGFIYIQIQIYLALLAVAAEAECKANKITILEKHQLLISTKYCVQCTFA